MDSACSTPFARRGFEGLLAAVTVLAVGVGCGGPEEGLPSRDALATGLGSSDSILGTPISDRITDCVADRLLEAGLPGPLLRALAERDDDFELSKSESTELDTALERSISTCMDELY